MKKIDDIIDKLKYGHPISTDEARVAGFLLEEMRRMEKQENNLVTVQMSPEMYRWFCENAYDDHGNYKVGSFQVTKLKNYK